MGNEKGSWATARSSGHLTVLQPPKSHLQPILSTVFDSLSSSGGKTSSVRCRLNCSMVPKCFWHVEHPVCTILSALMNVSRLWGCISSRIARKSSDFFTTSQWRALSTLGNARPCSFPQERTISSRTAWFIVGIFGPFHMLGQSRDFHDLAFSAGRIRRCVGLPPRQTRRSSAITFS
jgi:hypothetical protein